MFLASRTSCCKEQSSIDGIRIGDDPNVGPTTNTACPGAFPLNTSTTGLFKDFPCSLTGRYVFIYNSSTSATCLTLMMVAVFDGCDCSVYTWDPPAQTAVTTSVLKAVPEQVTFPVTPILFGTSVDTDCGIGYVQCSFSPTLTLNGGAPLPAWMSVDLVAGTLTINSASMTVGDELLSPYLVDVTQYSVPGVISRQD